MNGLSFLAKIHVRESQPREEGIPCMNSERLIELVEMGHWRVDALKSQRHRPIAIGRLEQLASTNRRQRFGVVGNEPDRIAVGLVLLDDQSAGRHHVGRRLRAGRTRDGGQCPSDETQEL